MARKRPVVNKRKRAQALADRLKDALGLDACVPLLTPDSAAEYGRELPDNLYKFYLEREGIKTAVQVSRRHFLARDYNEDEFFQVVARSWLNYLNMLAAGLAINTYRTMERVSESTS